MKLAIERQTRTTSVQGIIQLASCAYIQTQNDLAHLRFARAKVPIWQGPAFFWVSTRCTSISTGSCCVLREVIFRCKLDAGDTSICCVFLCISTVLTDWGLIKATRFEYRQREGRVVVVIDGFARVLSVLTAFGRHGSFFVRIDD